MIPAAKTAITAADLLNDRVLPFFDSQGAEILRMLTDRGTEFCGRHDEHPYQLFLAVGVLPPSTVAISPLSPSNEVAYATFRQRERLSLQ